MKSRYTGKTTKKQTNSEVLVGFRFFKTNEDIPDISYNEQTKHILSELMRHVNIALDVNTSDYDRNITKALIPYIAWELERCITDTDNIRRLEDEIKEDTEKLGLGGNTAYFAKSKISTAHRNLEQYKTKVDLLEKKWWE